MKEERLDSIEDKIMLALIKEGGFCFLPDVHGDEVQKALLELWRTGQIYQPEDQSKAPVGGVLWNLK